MINKIKWILLLAVFPSIGHSGESCTPAAWNKNLLEFKRLESSYNNSVKVFNALLTEHKQRSLLSETFSLNELATLWRVKSRREVIQTQIDSSESYYQELSQKIEGLTKLREHSRLSARAWEQLAQSCKTANEPANQITAEWYHSNANQLAKDYTNLSSQYLGLAKLYDQEANLLKRAQTQYKPNH